MMNKKKIQERLKHLVWILHEGKQSKFAEELGICKSTVCTYLKDDFQHRIRAEFLINIAKKFNISIDWLLLGRGNPFLSKESSSEHAKEFGEVLSNCIHDVKVKQPELLEDLDCTERELDHLISGTIEPTLKQIRTLIHKYRMNANTLIGRVGIPFLKESEIFNQQAPYLEDVREQIPSKPAYDPKDSYTAKLKPYLFAEDGLVTQFIRSHEQRAISEGMEEKEKLEYLIRMLQKELDYHLH